MRADRCFGVAIAILAALFIGVAVPTISQEWQKTTGAAYYTVGPRFFPFLAGGLCVALGLLVALFPDGRNHVADLWGRPARRNILVLLALTGGYAATLEALGFLLSTAAALALFLLAYRERRWWVIVPLAAAVPLIIEFVFVRFLVLELPAGLLAVPW